MLYGRTLMLKNLRVMMNIDVVVELLIENINYGN